MFQPTVTKLSADGTFTVLVAYWLEDMETENRLSLTTRQLHERNMRTRVMPAFAELTLCEIGVA